MTFLRKNELDRKLHMQEQVSFHMGLMMTEIRNLRQQLAKLAGGPRGDGLSDGKEEKKTLDQEAKMVWMITWCPPTNEKYSGVLAEAFGANWGLGYGHPKALSDDISIYVKCYDVEGSASVDVNYEIALLNPRNGEPIVNAATMRSSFRKGSEIGTMSLAKLSKIEEAGAFNKQEGLTTLVFRVTLKHLTTVPISTDKMSAQEKVVQGKQSREAMSTTVPFIPRNPSRIGSLSLGPIGPT
eukprot:TRINITY_DN11341_c0_g1_i4.p1 TRINITY_DN11341_c0_g1~~TRINITY_DN11341_c0_g1_i4.p1  ORF type:complete len:240 (-),score=24.70 TRINITY_DN11341_c0_g1_i4:92-811(-)